MEQDGGDGAAMELSHAIGFNGGANQPLHIEPSGTGFMYASGGCIVQSDLKDTSAQNFLRGHDRPVTCLDMTQSGTLAVSGQHGENADAVVWARAPEPQLEPGQEPPPRPWTEKYRLQQHDHGLAIVTFTECERFLMTIGVQADAKLVIWDMQTGNVVAERQGLPHTTCACWGGRKQNKKKRDTTDFQFVTGGENQLDLWTLDPHSGMLGQTPFNTGTQKRNYSAVSFSLNRQLVYAGSTSADFSALSVPSLVLHAITAACSGLVTLVQPVRQTEVGEMVLLGGGDGTVAVFDGDGRAYRCVVKSVLDGSVSALQIAGIDEDALQLVAGTAKGYMYLLTMGMDGQSSSRLIQESHFGPVRAVAYAPGTSDAFATCSEDGTLRLWDAGDYRVLSKGECQVTSTGTPSCLCFTGEALFSGWCDGKLRAHDAEPQDGDATVMRQLWQVDNCHTGGVTAVAVSHNRKFVVTGGEQGEVRAWEMRSREMLRHLKQHTMAVTAVAICNDDSELVSASRDKTIVIWDLGKGGRRASLSQRMGGIWGIALHPEQPEGKQGAAGQLLTVGQEQRVSFWNLANPQLTGNEAPMQSIPAGAEQLCICCNRKGTLFATAGEDFAIHLYEFKTGQLATKGLGHSGNVKSLSFSPDDKQLVSVGEDGNVMVWNIYE